MERIAPTIQAAKTTETLRPSRAISAGFRKMPVPIIVPTTMAAEAQAPSPRTSSRRFSVMSPQTKFLSITHRKLGACRGGRAYKGNPSDHVCRPVRREPACNGPNYKGYDRAKHEVPRIRHARKLKYA